MTAMVNIPVSRAELQQLRQGAPSGPRRGFAPTQRMLDAFHYETGDTEEAEYAATVIASVDAMLRHGERLVLAVATDDFEPDPGPDADFGAVEVEPFGWDRVQAIFADDAPGRDAAARAQAETPLADAWAADGVQSLIETHDLMWFGPSEADQL